ncbi:hypothetical protein EOD39_9211 [Acipenser ruthenus]|uniref:Uncharacterized protein n=1 Tax=Acipenser ruthenus TaxID=7906 RepID=A0A444U1B8_ACIRT|nr:hypothetical protein EOD39_9211 [Acipenser ruthenus]
MSSRKNLTTPPQTTPDGKRFNKASSPDEMTPVVERAVAAKADVFRRLSEAVGPVREVMHDNGVLLHSMRTDLDAHIETMIKVTAKMESFRNRHKAGSTLMAGIFQDLNPILDGFAQITQQKASLSEIGKEENGKYTAQKRLQLTQGPKEQHLAIYKIHYESENGTGKRPFMDELVTSKPDGFVQF